MNSIYRQVKHSSMAAIALTMLAALVLLAGMAIPAQAQTETLLYEFTGSPDGSIPYAGPLLKGTMLYGTTSVGGSASCGTVYAVSTTTRKETILHSFGCQPDGSLPYGGLAFFKGAYYGTTLSGGKNNSGTIYKIAKKGKSYVETVLYSFSCEVDGCNPEYVTPILDKAGNLYGTAFNGGTYNNGTVFKLAPNGTLTTLHSFNGSVEGYNPVSGVVLDKKGNIYGTTAIGGAYADGTLYKITAAGVYSTLYSFTGKTDGWSPRSALVLDKKGNLYGTTQLGGNLSLCGWGCGVVFEFNPITNEETVLYTFVGGTDGWDPLYGPLVFDKQGNLYGTTAAGGVFPSGSNLGTVYKLAPNGTETILFAFDLTNGGQPEGSVALDKQGNVYTTASGGGDINGTVIKITP